MWFWTVRNVVRHISKSWNNEQWCVWNCNTAKEGSPKLCLPCFTVAMRCDRCIYLFVYLVLNAAAPSSQSSSPPLCPANVWVLRLNGALVPSHRYGSYSSGCFSKLRRRRPKYPDPISKSRELDFPERQRNSGRWRTTKKQNKLQYERIIQDLPVLYLQQHYRQQW